MLTPTKHSHPDRTVLNGVSDAVKRQYWNNPSRDVFPRHEVAEVSLLLLARLKARRLDDYSSLCNYTKKAVGGGDILFLPALNLNLS
jgi:hypothetical protein